MHACVRFSHVILRRGRPSLPSLGSNLVCPSGQRRSTNNNTARRLASHLTVSPSFRLFGVSTLSRSVCGWPSRPSASASAWNTTEGRHDHLLHYKRVHICICRLTRSNTLCFFLVFYKNYKKLMYFSACSKTHVRIPCVSVKRQSSATRTTALLLILSCDTLDGLAICEDLRRLSSRVRRDDVSRTMWPSSEKCYYTAHTTTTSKSVGPIYSLLPSVCPGQRQT